jgi:hypothetical protein
MVHFPGFARVRLWIHRTVIRVYRIGFPHSEIPGSKPACGSPRLIAACHVLHRHRLPRHPPCALSSLTIKFTQHIRDPEPRQRLRKLYVAICSSLRLASATPADIRQLIKFNTQPCRLPNLFSCQTSSAAEAASRLGGSSKFLPVTQRQTRWRSATIRFPSVYSFRRSQLLKDSGKLVELTGIEPVTPWLQTRCSPS